MGTFLLPGLFVVGTDTEVGKTWVTAGIARTLSKQGRRVGVLKPVATGAFRDSEGVPRSEDVEALIRATGRDLPREMVCPLLYEAPLAPVVAARQAGMILKQDDLEALVREALTWWSNQAECLLIEGIGGLLCPLAEGTTLADLAVTLDYPLLIVARRGLGTLNHTLLTVEAAQRRDLRIAGLILNQACPAPETPATATNLGELARRLPDVPILAEIPFQTGTRLAEELGGKLDWIERMQPPRHSRLFKD